MSAQPVSKDDIIKGNPFSDIAKEIELAVTQLTEFDAELKKVSVELSNVAKNSKSTIDGINAINLAEKQSKKIVDEKLANDKLLAKIKNEQQSAEQSLQRQREKGMAQMAREAKLIKSEQQSAEQSLQRQRERGMAQMAKEAQRTAEAERPYKKLRSELSKLEKQYQDLAVQGRESTAEARKLKLRIDELRTTSDKANHALGRFNDNVGNYPNGFKSAIGALGQLGVAFSGVAIAKSAFNTIRDFDEANADMAKTLGISTEEAGKLSMGFTKLGSVTDIKGLQEIATIGGQFGISAGEIGGFVSSMDKLNVALGSDFGGVEETAKQLGALRNIFTDIKTENIDQDLLGIGNALNELSSKGAKVEIVSDFANRISGLATPLGVTAGEILGLSATLAKLNVNAERGGTAVGTIFQRMTQDASGFAEVAGVSTEEFTKLLNEDMVGAFKLVAKSFKVMEGDNVLMSKTLESLKLTGSGASEVFLKMASNTDLLDSNIKLSTESLKEQDSILQEVEKKSSTVGASVAKLGNAWDSFILGVNDGTGAQNGIITFFDFVAKNLPTIISTLAKLTAGFVAYKTAIALANTDFKALLSNFTKLKTDATDATGKMSGFGNALKGIGWSVAIGFAIDFGMKLYDIASGARQAEIDLMLMNKQLEVSNKRVQSNIDKFKSKRDQDTKNAKSEKDKLMAEQNYQKSLKESADAVARRMEKTKQELEVYKRTRKAYDENAGALGGLVRAQTRLNKDIGLGATGISDIDDKIAQLTADYKSQENAIKAYNAELTASEVTTREVSKATDLSTNATKNNTKAVKENTKERKDATDQINTLLASMKALDEFMSDAQIDENSKQFEQAMETQLQSINESGEYSIDLLTDLIEKEREYRTAVIERQYAQDMASASNVADEELALAKRNKALQDLDESMVDKRKKTYKELELAQEEYANKSNEISDKESEKQKKIDDEKIEQQKELANEINKIQEGISEALKEQIDRRIELSKKEEESAKSRQDFFENLAENGNITAQQSISEQIEIQREAQEEQARLERKKQQIEMISAGLSTFNASIANGKTPASALAETVLSTTTLVGILKNLNFFAKGTDNAPAGLAVVDEKGAELIADKHGNIKEIGTNKGARFTMLEQGDKVLTATKTASFLNSMKVAEPKIDKAGNSMDLIKINETLKRIESQNKGNSMSVDWGGISGGVANIVEKKITGRSRTVNVFRS